jgi:hypothetical protein
MSAPGPPWTPEEDRLLRSTGAAGESNAAQAHCGGGASPGSPTRDQVGLFAARAEAEVEMTSPDTKSPDSTTDIASANPPAGNC